MKEPKIRFKEFKGEWESNKIGNFSSSFSGGTPTAGVSEFYGGDIPFIRSGEIHEDKTELFLTEKGYNNSSAKIVDRGTLLYALYGATSGDVAISKIKGAINQAILAITPYKLVEKEFLSNFLLCNKDKIVGELLQGGQGNLSGSLVKDIIVTYPCIPEQQKIASFFTTIDAQISASTSRLASLKQIKAASLQAMFPQEGETVPKLRFKGFEGEWEKRKIGSFCCITIGEFVIKTKQNNLSPYPVYNGGSTNTGFYDLYNQIGPKVIVSARGANAGFVNKEEGPFWAGNSCYSIGTIDNSSWVFLFYSLKNHESEYIKRQQAANIPSLSKQDIQETTLQYPSTSEQRAIASYFTNLDRQITLQSRRLEKLKQIKAACLDKMFV